MPVRVAQAALARLGRLIVPLSLALALALALGLCAPSALAQTGYSINSVTPDELPAGSSGFDLTANVATGSVTPELCFNTGYGAGAAPLHPTSVTSTGNGYILTVPVPASSIQQIPASAYTGGIFNVYVYAQDPSLSTCTQTGYSDGSGQVQLNFPVATSLSLSSIPDQNPSLKSRVPSNVNIAGSNFLPSAGGSSTVVTFTAGSVTDSNVATLFVSSTEVRSNLPTNIPPGSGTLTVTVCNQSAGNFYCAAPLSLTLNPLAANPGTLTATPNPPAANQTVLFSAVFGPAQADFKNGAPGGLVSFREGSTSLGTAALILNNTAQLTTGESENDGVNQSTFQAAGYGATLPVQPIVADMNNDGVPDSVILDPEGLTFHILLGLPPYATDHSLSLASESFQCTSYPSFAIADFNGDGIPDIAFVCSTTSPASGLVTNTTYVMLGLGDGSSFTPQMPVPRTVGSMIAAGDFNGDGKADLVTLTTSTSGNGTPQVAFQVFTGNGDGTFNIQDVSGPFAAVPLQLIASDLNGDGVTDLVLLASAGSSGPGVYTFQNQQDGNNRFGRFAAPLQPINGDYTQVLVSPLVVSQAASPQCYDACTLPSLIAVSSGQLLTAINTSTAAAISFFSTLEAVDAPVLTSAAAGDFNGDGYADIAVVGNNGVRVLTGDGLGDFVGTTYPSLTDTSAPATGIVVGAPDENGDGFADLLVLNQTATDAYNITYTEQGYITSGTSAAVLTDAPGFAPGAHTITATTPGTYTLAGGSASTSFIIASSQTASTVTLSATPPSGSAFGQAVTVTAGIAGNGSADPSGTVSFYNGSQLVATVSLAGTSNPGTVTANYGDLHPGTYTLSAVYSGDANYTGSTGTLSYVIIKGTPVVNWSPNPSTIPFGTPLSSAQLDATANQGGTFVYTPSAGALLSVGPQVLTVVFTPTDTTDCNTVTKTVTITVTQATPTITWSPNPDTLVYGTPLSSAQLDATSPVAGSFAYTPAAGTVLNAGLQTLTAVFTPANTQNYKSVSATATITVTQATPKLTWPTPADIALGTPLSSTQLDATATGVTNATLPGTFTYTPPAGTQLSGGTHQLTTLFTPTDTVDYTPATASVPINVVAVTLTSISPNIAQLGDPDTTIVLAGTGFEQNASVLVGGTPVVTTFVSSTTLKAVIPASSFLTVGTLQISVLDPAEAQSTAALPLTVTAPPVSVLVSGPATTQTGLEPEITFQLLQPYPVDISGTFTLSFAPANNSPDDPMIRFASPGTNTTDPSGRTFAFSIPAKTTDTPTVVFQSGSTAGTITVNLALEAGGANITPSTVLPLVIAAPDAVPGITSVSLSASGKTLTVVVRGYSNTRELSEGNFHFFAASGKSLATTELQIDETSLFTGWYASAISAEYGSTFTYMQTFNLDQDASVVGGVQVVLTNGIGASALGSSF